MTPQTGGDRWQDWFEQDEQLLWEGAPSPNNVNWARNIFFSCFGVPFLVGGVVTAVLGVRYLFRFDSVGDPLTGLFLTAFSVPFLCVGGGLVAGGWAYDILAPRRVRYALSTRAGYVASSIWGRKMEVLPLTPLSRIEMTTKSNGTSTIMFRFEDERDSDGNDSVNKKGFEGIADGKLVYDLIRQQIRALSNPKE